MITALPSDLWWRVRDLRETIEHVQDQMIQSKRDFEALVELLHEFETQLRKAQV